MSAICGLSYAGGRSAAPEVLGTVMDYLSGFGHDGSGLRCCGPTVLGHQTVHVTRESRQVESPLVSENGSVMLTADLRLDDRESLCDRLGVTPAERSRTPDAVLLLRAYEKWDVACVEHLVGDFAFGLWDERKQRLFCACDHLGIKPLHYYHGTEFFAFAGDPYALLRIPGVRRRLNEHAIADHLAGNRGLDKTATFYRDVHRLPPAHALTVEPGGLRVRQYWAPDLDREIGYRSDDEYVEHYRELLDRAVSDRLRSAYPVASLLSGGLDSTTIACLAARHLKAEGRSPLVTISWVLRQGDPWPKGDERGLIDELHAHEDHIQGFFVTSDDKTCGSQLRRWQNGDRSNDGSEHLVETYEIARSAGARVILDGYGGDQLATSNGEGDLEDLLSRFRWGTFLHQVRTRASYTGGSAAVYARRALLEAYAPAMYAAYARWVGNGQGIPVDERLNACSVVEPAFAARIGLADRIRESARPRRLRRVRDRQWFLLTEREPQRAMEGLVLSAGVHGLEYRAPMFDRRLVEYCLAVPPEQHRHGWGRHLVRRAMAGLLPDTIRCRDVKTDGSPPDGFRLFARSSLDLAGALDRVAEEPLVQAYIDVPKLRRRLTVEIPAALERGATTFPGQGGILRGLAVAGFLAWHAENVPSGHSIESRHVS